MGGRAGVRVYTTEIFYDTSRTPIDWGLAGAYSMALVAGRDRAAVRLFPPDPPRRALPDHHRQGLSGRAASICGGWRYLTCALALLLVFLITGVPFLMMLYASLLPFYQAPSVAAFESMSFANYAALFESTKTIAADDQQRDPRPGDRDRRRVLSSR